jgi:hypothetical protein
VARSDLLVELVRAHSKGDQEHFNRALSALISEERAKQHHVLADRLTEVSQRAPNGAPRMNKNSHAHRTQPTPASRPAPA